MKAYPDKLASTLQPHLAPLYLISGDETLLVNECADQVRAAAREQGFTERDVFHTESGNLDRERFLQSANSMSLFAEKKLIEIRCGRKQLADNALQDYLERPNPDVVLLLITEKLDKKSQDSKWFQALERAGVFVQIWPMEGAQLQRWLAQRAKNLGLQIPDDAVRLLLERTEGNLLAAAQELDKLHLLYGNSAVSAEQLNEAVADSARYDVFQLVDAMLSGNSSNTLRVLRSLAEEGTAESAILWVLTKELHILANTSEAVQDGQPANSALQRQGVWDKRQPLYQQALKRHGTRAFYQFLQRANRIDQCIKGMGDRNPRVELENLCLALAGKRIVA